MRDVSTFSPTLAPVVAPLMPGGEEEGGGAEGGEVVAGDDETDKEEKEANIQEFGMYSIQVLRKMSGF